MLLKIIGNLPIDILPIDIYKQQSVKKEWFELQGGQKKLKTNLNLSDADAKFRSDYQPTNKYYKNGKKIDEKEFERIKKIKIENLDEYKTIEPVGLSHEETKKGKRNAAISSFKREHITGAVYAALNPTKLIICSMVALNILIHAKLYLGSRQGSLPVN